MKSENKIGCGKGIKISLYGEIIEVFCGDIILGKLQLCPECSKENHSPKEKITEARSEVVSPNSSLPEDTSNSELKTLDEMRKELRKNCNDPQIVKSGATRKTINILLNTIEKQDKKISDFIDELKKELDSKIVLSDTYQSAIFGIIKELNKKHFGEF